MGMYDEIRCERILPDGLNGAGRVFQTKDVFDKPDMTMYTITADDRLIADRWHYDVIPERKNRFDVIRRVTEAKDVDQNFDGDIGFYDFEIDGDISSPWHEYVAHFTNGTLTGIDVVEKENTIQGTFRRALGKAP